MTITAAPWLGCVLTLDEWDTLDREEIPGRAELVEGVLAVSPSPTGRHQRAGWRLAAAMEPRLDGALVTLDVEVLVEDGPYPTVRRPDVVVLHPGADLRRHRFAPSEVLAVFEILSPGTRGTDRVMKLHEYAQAGIAHYGIVDPGPPARLTEFALVDGLYRQAAEHTGAAALALGPTIDLDAL